MRNICIDVDSFIRNLTVYPDCTLSKHDLIAIRALLLACQIPEQIATAPSSILIEAEDVVNGREQATNRKYGAPEIVFERYAKIFDLIAPDEVFTSQGKLTALGVAYVLKCIKLGREKVAHKRDNLVDDCGYTEIIAKIRRHIENNQAQVHQGGMAGVCCNTSKDMSNAKEAKATHIDSLNKPLLHVQGIDNEEKESPHSEVPCSGVSSFLGFHADAFKLFENDELVYDSTRAQNKNVFRGQQETGCGQSEGCNGCNEGIDNRR